MMIQLNLLPFLFLTVNVILTVSAQQGADYLDAAPATVYEDTVMSPQNM
jgi:hypothetical protein